MNLPVHVLAEQLIRPPVSKQPETGTIAEGTVALHVNAIYRFGGGVQQKTDFALSLLQRVFRSYSDNGQVGDDRRNDDKEQHPGGGALENDWILREDEHQREIATCQDHREYKTPLRVIRACEDDGEIEQVLEDGRLAGDE